MKAITLLQPWASLVVIGAKTIETRSWNSNYRGSILIHAGLSKAGSIFSDNPIYKKHLPDFNSLPFGAIIGEVSIREIVKIGDLNINEELVELLTLEEKAFGNYSNGRYAWLLENPIQYKKHYPFRGSLNIWNVPFEVIQE